MHFLRRANPRQALFVSFAAVALFLSNRHFLPAYTREQWYYSFLLVAFYSGVFVEVSEETEEFDLILPVRRVTLYFASSLATLLLTVSLIVPLVVALAITAFREGHPEVLWACATIALCWIATLLMTVPLLRLARRMSPPFAALIAGFPLVAMFVLLLAALIGWISPFLPAVVTAFAAPPICFLGGWHFEHYELAPRRDAGLAQIVAARSGLMDRFPPLVRVLARSVWLQWRYWLLVVFAGYMAGMSCMLAAAMAFDIWVFHIMLYVGTGYFMIMFLSWNGSFLLLFVARRKILRSVLGPIAAVPLLVGGVGAVAARSAQMIVWGLVTALIIVGATWLWLPWAKEYRRRSATLTCLRAAPIIFLLVFCFVPWLNDSIHRSLSIIAPYAASRVDGNPILLSCVIFFAIALLWWRCERKFRYFEPRAQEEPSPWTWRTSSSN
jgi:hypothetical protein